MERRDKINYYLDIAEAVTGRGTCLRRNFGAVIVKNDTIISTGYVGAPRGRANCNELHYCTREKLQVPRGERYELCRSVHAAARCWVPPCTWWGWKTAPAAMWRPRRPAPFASV